jgi:hypothetical protein
MDVKEHDRLSKITLPHKLKLKEKHIEYSKYSDLSKLNIPEISLFQVSVWSSSANS